MSCIYDNPEYNISFYFFLKESENIFRQFVTTVGRTNPVTGELYLEDNPAFRNYKKKTRKALDEHTNTPRLTQIMKDFFLDKCRYYLHPEKRKPYKLKNGEEVESVGAFSERCVAMFFQLTGIDFSILRIDPRRKEDIVDCQKECLEDLFSSVLTIFMEEKLCSNVRSFQEKPIIYHNLIRTEDFKKWVRFLYVRYRHVLLSKDADLFGKLLCSEMKKITDYERKTSIKLCHVVYKPGIQYNLYRNEVDKENESLMSDVNTLLFKIENGIRLIHNAKSPEEVKKIFRIYLIQQRRIQKKIKKCKEEIGKISISNVSSNTTHQIRFHCRICDIMQTDW